MDSESFFMRILYILSFFPVTSETFILNEIVEAQNQGHEMMILRQNENTGALTHKNLQHVKNIHTLKPVSLRIAFWLHFQLFLHSPVRYLKTFRAACRFSKDVWQEFVRCLPHAKQIQKLAPDHLHAHFAAKPTNTAYLFHLYLNIPFSFTSHRYDLFEANRRDFKSISAAAKKHVTISQFNKDFLISRYQVNPDDVDVIHCGIDFESIKDLPPVKKEKKTIPQILSIARLIPFKGHDILIKACARLKAQGIAFHCQIIGEGEYRQELEQLIQSLDLCEQITLRGALNHEEVFQSLQQADVFVLASRSEGIPVSVMEAMALRVPVIATRIMGIPELVEEGVTGWLIEPDSVEQTASALTQVLRGGPHEKILENAYRKVYEQFNLKTEVAKLIDVWQS